MANNPMDYLRQLEQMGEQMRQMFGNGDFMKNMIPNMPNLTGSGQPTANSSPFNPGIDWMRGQYPRVDLFETLRDLVAVVEIAGLQSANDVTVSVEPERLRVQGIIPQLYGSISRERMHISERHQGAFEREIPLPIPVLPNDVHAKYKNGLLEIAMKKDQRYGDKSKGHTVPISF